MRMRFGKAFVCWLRFCRTSESIGHGPRPIDFAGGSANFLLLAHRLVACEEPISDCIENRLPDSQIGHSSSDSDCSEHGRDNHYRSNYARDGCPASDSQYSPRSAPRKLLAGERVRGNSRILRRNRSGVAHARWILKFYKTSASKRMPSRI